jgi:transglutaminase-like putative cysteine protease
MRIKVMHRMLFRYEPAAAGVIQMLRLTPRNHEGQYVVDWRIDLSADCRLDCRDDAFGNVTHSFSADGPLPELSIQVEGEVETQDTSGIVRGSIERFPPALFLRETALTAPDKAIRELAEMLRQGGSGDTLSLLHGLLCRIHDAIAFEAGSAEPAMSASEAFVRGRGPSQDLAHVFISAARCLGIPARYATGYVRCEDGELDAATSHAWAEAFVPTLGWVGFDPVNAVCPTETHVRVAIGLDHLGAAPARTSRYGVGGEALSVVVRVAPAAQSGHQRQQ